MKKKDMTIALADVVKETKDIIYASVFELTDGYVSDGKSNSTVNDEIDMHDKLVRHEILSSLHSYIKKEFDNSKSGLDDTLTKMGVDTEGSPGITKTIYEDKEIKFNKKQNKDGTSISTTDLLNELNKLGVPKETIDNAVDGATKLKRGNVYYLIEVND